MIEEKSLQTYKDTNKENFFSIHLPSFDEVLKMLEAHLFFHAMGPDLLPLNCVSTSHLDKYSE